MEGVPSNWLIPAGAILAALIAGLFSFFNLVLSKEQKLSELRQNWIDGLRNDIAEYISAVLAIEHLDAVYRHQHGDSLNYVDLSKATHEPHVNGSIALNRILLRLNPSDKSPAAKALLSELNKMKQLFSEAKYVEVSGCIPEMRKQAQLFLKAEWERVKKGEPTFRWSKRIALVILSAAIALGTYLAIHTQVQPHNEAVKNDVISETHSQARAANKGIEPTR